MTIHKKYTYDAGAKAIAKNSLIFTHFHQSLPTIPEDSVFTSPKNPALAETKQFHAGLGYDSSDEYEEDRRCCLCPIL